MSETLRSFPEESPGAPWPSLIPTNEDMHYEPKEVPKRQQAKSLTPQTPQAHYVQRPASPVQSNIPAKPVQSQADQRKLFVQDLQAAIGYGTLLGLMLSGLLSTFVFQWFFWLQGWNWLYGTAALILLTLLSWLFGPGRGIFIWCILAMLSGLALTVSQLMRGQASLFFVLLISLFCCITARVIAECFYVPRMP